jgi:hypothetical protein
VKPRLAEVKTLYSHNATETVKMLRMLADNIESGQLPNIVHTVCSVRNRRGQTQHYAWGEMTADEALSLHSVAISVLTEAVNAGPIHDDERTAI